MKFWLLALLLTVALAFPQAQAATITIVNGDGAGEGFNDPTPFTPVGGNNATTLGQARLNAFRYAADLAAARISSNVTIQVDAAMDSLGGSGSSAILGAAGPTTIHGNFTNAPVTNTWYVQALANARSGSDLHTASDIDAQFNSDVDNGTVLGSTDWYYGFDGNPGGDIDFVTVVLHEILHGLGFLSLVDESTGAKFAGFDDAYMRHLEHHGATPSDFPTMSNGQRVTAQISGPNLHWTGAAVTAAASVFTGGGVSNGHVQMFAPGTLQLGSSVSHFDTALFPNDLMEPNYTTALQANTPAAFKLLADIGWTVNESPSTDLSISVSDTPDPATVANNLTYSVTVTNGGPNIATGVAVTDVLPAGVSHVSATPSQGSCSGTSTVTCYLGTVANAGNATVSIVVRPTTTNAALSNTVSVTSVVTDASLANNSASTTTTVNNPVPAIANLNPATRAPGSGAFILIVNGGNFVNGSSVLWNGSARTTTYVSSAQITASILATDVTTAGTASVTVFNPAPVGGTSNTLTFNIAAGTAPPSVSTINGGGGGGGCSLSPDAGFDPTLLLLVLASIVMLRRRAHI